MPKSLVSVLAPVVGANVALLAVATNQAGSVLLLLLAVPAGLIVARRPQVGLLALVAIAPFDGLLLLFPEADLLRGWKEAVVLGTLAATFVAPRSARGLPGRARPAWVPGAAALVVLGMSSVVVLGGAQGLLGLKISFFYLLVPWIAWRCPLNERERDRVVTVLLVTGIAAAVYGLVQQVMGPEGLLSMGYQYNSEIRFSGPYLRSFSSFIQPFPFALFLMLVVLLAVSAALSDPSRLRSRVTVTVLPLLGIALAFTFVRAAWLGLGIGLLLLGIRRHRVVLAGVPVALLLLALLPGSVASTAFSGDSSQDRIATWSENLGAVRERPLGSGIGSGGSAAVRAIDEGTAGEREDDLLLLPDNHYFKVLYELGVVGLWLFLLVLAVAYRSVRALARASTGRDAALAWGITASIAACVTASLMANLFEIFPVDLLFWLLLGVASSGFGQPSPAATTNPDDRVPAAVG